MNALPPRKRTTLAELERGAYARRKSNAVGAAARSLGNDVLAQIDLVKGRLPGKRRRGLHAILHSKKNGAHEVKVVARSYDIGAPVRASPAFTKALEAQAPSQAEAWATGAAGADEASTTAFTVELFDAGVLFPVPPAPGEGSMEPPIAALAPPGPGELPMPMPPGPFEVPAAFALSQGMHEDGVLGLDLAKKRASGALADDVDEFERELQSILSGNTTRATAGTPSSAPSSAPASVAAQSAPEPAKPHDVFEQMGRNMSYANAFNLPAMELHKRFDDIEREIAREETVTSQAPPAARALDLTDDDINEGLRLPAAAPSPAPVVPAPTAPPSPPAGDARSTMDAPPASAPQPPEAGTPPVDEGRAAPSPNAEPAPQAAENGRPKA